MDEDQKFKIEEDQKNWNGRRPKKIRMEDYLKNFKMEDDLKNVKMEDYLKNFKMEDDLKNFN